MLTRRQLLTRGLQGASLLAFGNAVPGFVANTARAAPAGKDTILVVIELTGGNDGLDTVIPYADDNYHQARPTLRLTKERVVRIDDHIGLHPALKGLDALRQNGQLAIVQGVGYPNPSRSHFDSMDVWQSAAVSRPRSGTGWLARGLPGLAAEARDPTALHVGAGEFPLALTGATDLVETVNGPDGFGFDLGRSPPERRAARMKLMAELARPDDPEGEGLLPFIQRKQLQIYTGMDRLQEILQNASMSPAAERADAELLLKLHLVSEFIAQGMGSRVYYVSLGGFDTHAAQAATHGPLLRQLGDALAALFHSLKRTGHDKRVVALTFSEFGRRLKENGSEGTDHGAASCLFVAGPAVRGGVVGKHPSLADVDSVGDPKFHTDFRRVYATLLDRWLGCDSKTILGRSFEHLDLVRRAGK